MRLDHPALVAAGDAGVAVRSEIDLAGERTTVPIVAVTGTNGKTTVTTLTAAMLGGVGPARGRGGESRPAPHRRGRRSGRRDRRRGVVVPTRVLRDVPPPRERRARDHPRPSRLARDLRGVRRGQGADHASPERRRRVGVRCRRCRRDHDRGRVASAHAGLLAPRAMQSATRGRSMAASSTPTAR